YIRHSPRQPESSAGSYKPSQSFPEYLSSRSPDAGIRRNKPSETPSDIYPRLLAGLCSDSMRQLYDLLRRKHVRDPNRMKLKTTITMGIKQKEFERFHNLLLEASTTRLPGSAQDQSDPFMTNLTLSLLQFCALLEETEYCLHISDTSSKWQQVQTTINHFSRLGRETEHLEYSESDDSGEEDPGLGVESIHTLRPLARSLALGFPGTSDERSFSTCVEDIQRSLSSLDSFIPGLELRIYMSSLRHYLSSLPTSRAEPNREEREEARTSSLNEAMKKHKIKTRGSTYSRA
ncbi:hypothetical protein D6D10_09808, partial [Aureobasidium pullulans]